MRNFVHVMNIIKSHIERTVALLLSLLSLTLYSLTLSPIANIWDCGEFILTSRYLEVGHPPGAPLYSLLARLFSLFAPDASHVALCVNALSAVASALSVGFLFLITVYIIRLAWTSASRSTTIIAASISASVFAVSDSFWFSAVEAEVYALSLCFTSASLWAILKWQHLHHSSDASHARWLWLSIFIVGMSAGVHLLSLLTIPIITLVIFCEVRPHTLPNITIALTIGVISLAIALFGVISNGMQPAMTLEMLLAIAGNMPMHSGTIICAIITFVSLFIVVLTTRRSRIIHSISLALLLFSIGYSSNALIIIRSCAKPTVNLNAPDNVFALNAVINREQYGSNPIFYGPWYNAQPDDVEYETTFRRDSSSLAYESFSRPVRYHYPDDQKVLFPRMYSHEPYHRYGYSVWADVDPASPSAPSLASELAYTLKYQLCHMYVRYLMWNFAGRQNDEIGIGNPTDGNWISGISLVDSYLGQRHSIHPDELNSPARTRYFLLPLLAAVVGIIIMLMCRRTRHVLYLTALLFFLTGPAIALYLNQTPFEPRERDYAYVGSFMTFTIYIGVAIYHLLSLIHRRLQSTLTTSLASVAVFIALPGWMLFQNYPSHDRSSRTIDTDIARSYLALCDTNAILITNGDNDTYPLWYVQEVEGCRRDVRVINYGLAGADWYVAQVTSAQRNSLAIPTTIEPSHYRQGQLADVYVKALSADTMDLREALSVINTRSTGGSDNNLQLINCCNLRFPTPEGDSATIHINEGFIAQNDLLILDFLATDMCHRPVYVTAGSPVISNLGLDSLTLDLGPVVRICPTTAMKDSLTQIYQFLDSVRLSPARNYFMPHDIVICLENMNIRPRANQLAQMALQLGNPQLATDILARSVEAFPLSRRPTCDNAALTASLLHQSGNDNAAREQLRILCEYFINSLSYYADLAHSNPQAAQQGFNYLHDFASNLATALHETSNTDLYDAVANYIEVYDLK